MTNRFRGMKGAAFAKSRGEYVRYSNSQRIRLLSKPEIRALQSVVQQAMRGETQRAKPL